MLLETLDTKLNDVVIYSKNIFNLDNNFKIIYKDAAIKKPHSIGYYEVCNFVNNPSPKVVIGYRLLTNLNNFNLRRTQYGLPIYVDNNPDLIFFDPVFAVKELESLSGAIDIQHLRFRIQQIGLNSLVKKGDKPNFTEIYCFDLSSKEAITQNDKTYADAIFALDENFIDSEDADIPAPKLKKQPQQPTESTLNVDKDYSNKDFNKFIPSAPVQEQMAPVQKRKTEFGDFLVKNKPKETYEQKNTITGNEKKSFIQVFKTTGPLNEYIHSRNEEPVILKFNK